MWANNETGVLFPVEEIAEIWRSRGVLYHCDAVQAVGKVEIDVQKVPADYLSLTGHKFHVSKGIGAVYVRRKSAFSPLVCGGHQERDGRGGTESVPLMVGLIDLPMQTHRRRCLLYVHLLPLHRQSHRTFTCPDFEIVATKYLLRCLNTFCIAGNAMFNAQAIPETPI
jgi:cysteine sulfinate desulfinase/cysteine desulfurase-like protein